MIEFQVQDMTCGHCQAAITKAVQNAAPQAAVQVDLDRHLVTVTGADDAASVEAAIREAGYSPVKRS